MTTDANVTPTDAKAAYARPPRTVRLALIAASVTAMLAGPVALALILAGQAVLRFFPLGFTDVPDAIERLAQLLMYSILGGLVGSAPATIVNALLLAYLARRRWDASWLAIALGLTLGLLVGTTIAVLAFLLDAEYPDVTLTFCLPFTMAGGLMGALHWRIAIQPRRRWRLFQERERAALLAME